MRVGLFGGSFNPAHEGHAHVAAVARARLKLDLVLWLVSPQNPLKTERAASLAERMAGVRAFAKPWSRISGIEADLGSPYTIDTIVWFKARYPAVRFFWLMGSDNLASFHRWRRWREIPSLIEVAVVARGQAVRARCAPGARVLRKSGRARFLDAPLNAASSTALRIRARD